MSKRILSIIAVFVFLFSFSLTEAFAAAPGDGIAQPMEILHLSKTVTYTASNGNRINVKINYSARPELSNTSGYYITGITSLYITNKSGWTSVQSSPESFSFTYYENHQRAIIFFTYRASVGADYANYTGAVTLNT